MPDPLAVLIPLLNANEPEARLVELRVASGDQVKPGQILCTLETTKSAVELAAEGPGTIVGLEARQGDMLRAGDRLCWISADANWKPDEGKGESAQTGLPAGLRITQPALQLARRVGIDLEALARGPLITEAAIQAQSALAQEPAALEGVYDRRALVVYGGGGHGKSLIELVRAGGMFDLVGVLDDRLERGNDILGLEVLGGAAMLAELARRGVRQAINAIGGVGDSTVRVAVFQRLHEAGFFCPTVIHPTAVLEPSAELSSGVQVMPRAYIGSQARIGYGSIVNTAAVVSHDCTIGDYANIAPGALLAGGVEIGDRSLIGMGATLNLEVHVGEGSRIGNGATVKQDVPAGGVVHAGSVWPPRATA